MREGDFFDDREVLQTPVVLGIAEHKFDVEPQLVIVTRPTGEFQHGDSSRHREHRTHNPAKLALW